jgi:alanyl-tRNA synthetase
MWKYYEDPYLKELQTSVEDVSNNQVILADTIFYPTGGGQPHDKGTISGADVLDVLEQGEAVVHVLEDVPFSAGDEVTCTLDWEYRYAIMRMHSALHLMFNVAGELFSISDSAGSNVGAEKSRLDLVYDEVIDQDKRAQLREAFDRVVGEDRPLSVWWEGSNRLVQIEGYEQMPCGGLHIKSTKEIGHLSKLKRKNVGKGKERVEVFL